MGRLSTAVAAALLLAACGGDDAGSDADGGDGAAGVAADGGRDARAGWAGPDGDYDPTAELDLTELPHDEELLIGRLDNGLTYYLRSNDVPSGRVDVSLVVRAGSVNEPDGAGSAARYLARVLFKGTEGYPGGELVEALTDIGLDAPVEVFVESSWDETVYSFSVATDADDGEPGGAGDGPDDGEPGGAGFGIGDDADAGDGIGDGWVDGVGGGIGAAGAGEPEQADVRKALDVLAEMASAALLEPEDVESERRAILDGYKQATESGHEQVGNALDDLYIVGTPYEGKHPFGNLDAIKSMTAETLREFYETWYQPSNMAVVVVGDLPAPQLEEMVSEFFGGLEDAGSSGLFGLRIPGRELFGGLDGSASGPAQPLDGFAVELDPEPVVESLALPGAGPTRVSLDWPVPVWPEGTVGGERGALIDGLVRSMLMNRLMDEFRNGGLDYFDPPFLIDFFTGRGLRFHGTNFGSADPAAALTDFLAVMEGAAMFGFIQQELDRAIALMREALEAEVRGERGKHNRDYVDMYIRHFVRGAYLDTAEGRLSWYTTQLGELTADEVSAYWRWVWEHAGPIVVPYGEDEVSVPTAEAMAAAIEDVEPLYTSTSGGDEIYTMGVAPAPGALVS